MTNNTMSGLADVVSFFIIFIYSSSSLVDSSSYVVMWGINSATKFVSFFSIISFFISIFPQLHINVYFVLTPPLRTR